MTQTGDHTVYRWPRARLVGVLGRLVLMLGAVWLVVTLVVASTGASGRIPYAVLVFLSLGVVLLAGYVFAFPPAVLELTGDGYRVRNLRGGGARSARWEDVTAVSTGESVAGPVLVLEGRGRAPSVIPLELLGPRAGEAQQRVRSLLDAAHRYRPL